MLSRIRQPRRLHRPNRGPVKLVHKMAPLIWYKVKRSLGAYSCGTRRCGCLRSTRTSHKRPKGATVPEFFLTPSWRWWLVDMSDLTMIGTIDPNQEPTTAVPPGVHRIDGRSHAASTDEAGERSTLLDITANPPVPVITIDGFFNVVARVR